MSGHKGLVRAGGIGHLVSATDAARVRRFVAAIGMKNAAPLLRTSEITLEAMREGGRVRPHVTERILAALAVEEEKLARVAS